MIKKIKEKSGASLAISLILFLVCAMAASLVITAATASGGRLSNMRKMDQRYYSVTSAAELLRDTICASDVKITQKCVTKMQSGSIIDEDVTTTVDKSDIIKHASAIAAFGDEDWWNNMSAWNLEAPYILADKDFGTFKMVTSKAAASDVKVTATLKKEGYLEFILENVTSSSEPEAYTLKMTCMPEMPVNGTATSTTTVDDSSDPIYTTTQTKDVTVTWKEENCVIERP